MKRALGLHGLLLGGAALTRPLPERAAREQQRRSSQWLDADPHYVWNAHLGALFLDAAGAEGASLLTPVVAGYVGAAELSHGARATLVARRQVGRPGKRWWTRGSDEWGHVANGVASELVVEADGAAHSLVQLRGSIPVAWSQPVAGAGLRWEPKIVVEPEDSWSHIGLLRVHFGALLQRHERVHCIDLLKHGGKERALHEAFERTLSAWRAAAAPEDAARVTYSGFDFSKRVRHGSPAALDELFAEVPSACVGGALVELPEAGAAGACRVSRPQAGVVRTNCKDCLDRTNAVQAELAMRWTAAILKRPPPEDERLLRELWVGHGDTISLQYAGTRACSGAG